MSMEIYPDDQYILMYKMYITGFLHFVATKIEAHGLMIENIPQKEAHGLQLFFSSKDHIIIYA